MFGAEFKNTEFVFEGLEDAVIYRYRTIMVQIDRDWSVEAPPRNLLEKSWLRLTANAMKDGQWINERIVIRDNHPMLTNSLLKVPENDLEKLPFKELLESRIVQCKLIRCFKIFKQLEKKCLTILLDNIIRYDLISYNLI